MITYQLALTVPGQPPAIREVTGATPPDLAEAVHQHARGILGTRRVEVTLDSTKLVGTVRSHHAHAGDFTLTEAANEEPAGQRQPMHGYTLTDLHHLTQTVLRLDRWHTATDVTDRYDAVWHALAEHLCTADEAPTRRALISVGIRASDRHVHGEMRHRGWSADHPGHGSHTAPGYQRFWFAAHTPSPEDGVVDRIALAQVWPLLTPRQQQALTALAAYGTYQAAAHAIGASPRTFTSIVAGARRRFYRWWHQGETAPTRPWRKDKRISAPTDSSGKPRLTVSQVEVLRDRVQGGERLRAVAADAGVPVSTLSALLRGTRRPAPDPAGGEAA
ncbi:helix-turn-helix transcriptional regulator [Wenjunlia vitaminophila]|uniref:helix-turn-helix transcriptional regulator n=1 Tax=Wenjunlia vitaminophila TaxID=76728 RepID=UPI00037EB462|nr:hypothetical protein [Wenjunlia vitaminophila]